ncbi:type IV pilus modification PilV family protein [Sporosarcina ureilytica]|uniref:Prepilin-type N-terminal cleavage/methylation domain-containing protein n=1 Tax=Sporosarcina ureilytica TaxID=298596 RepID=A0A1D8JFY8_9BACL|nr:prepilin-type N-terminal cleavage/methylation domain-containing protein [Sporosarcina ureilytica]AOV07588.1 hypothetical protein BI350_08610 [Sporosarcina ureilytica]
MQRINVNRKESGLTLIEVLASIVILSIVLISFSSLLLQSTKHTKYNKEKLTAVQVAEEIVAEVRSGNYQQSTTIIGSAGKRYEGYKIAIEIDNGPADLKKALITVTSLPETGMKKSSFTTEMYFDSDEVSS